MRILHISDTHLGARPKGIVERERDIYEVFREIIDIAIENKVDLVLHAGDMFHDTELYPAPYIVAIEALSRLKGSGIGFYAVAGNHDAVKPTRNSPLELLHRLGYLTLLSDDREPGVKRVSSSTGYEIEIHGFSYKAAEKLFKEPLKPSQASILLAHVRLCDAWSQRYGRDQTLCSSKEAGAPVVSKMPRGYLYYALGDLHRSWRSIYGGSPIAYPGSPETISRDDYEEVKKVLMIEIDRGYIDVKEMPLRSVRPWIYIDARDYRDLVQKIYEAETRARTMHKSPMLVVKVRSMLERSERDRVTSMLDQLVREKRILNYDGPEIEASPRAVDNIHDLQTSSIGIEGAVERLFKDHDVKSFIIDTFIKSRLSGDLVLKKLLENQNIIKKLFEEPEIKKYIQNRARLGV
jgi:DNA repair exonuclease SbcCD nuclease subunit